MIFRKYNHQDLEEVATNIYKLGVLCHENKLDCDAHDYFIESIQTLKEVYPYSPVSSLSLHRIGRFHLERGELPQALKRYKEALNLEEKCIEVSEERKIDTLCSLGDVLYHFGDLDSSLYHLLCASDFSNVSKKKKVHLLLARNYARRGERSKSLDHLREAISRDKGDLSDNIQNKILLGSVYQELRQWDVAIDHYEECLDLLQVDSNLVTYDLTLVQINLAACYSASKNHDKARDYLEKGKSMYIIHFPHDNIQTGNIFENFGIIEEHASNLNKAIEYFEKAVTIRSNMSSDDPKVFELIHRIGSCHASKKDFSFALQYLSSLSEKLSALNRQGMLQRVNLSIAHLHKELGDFKTSLKLLNNVLSFHTNGERSIFSNLEIADIRMHIGSMILSEGDRQHAIQCFQMSIGSFESYFAETHEQNDSDGIYLSKVIFLYSRMIELLNSDTQIENNARLSELRCKLGDAYARDGNFKKALSLYEKVLSFRVSTSDHDLAVAAALHNIGNCYFILGRIPDAISNLESSLNISKKIQGEGHEDVVNTMFILAKAYDVNSDFDIAITTFQRVLKTRGILSGSESIEAATVISAIGQSLLSSQRYETALNTLQLALVIFSKQTDYNLSSIQLQIGKCHSALGHFEKALNHLEVSIACEKMNSPQALYEIGQIFDKRSENAKGLECFDRAMSTIGEKHGVRIPAPCKVKEDTDLSHTLADVLVTAMERQQELLLFIDDIQLYGILLDKRNRTSEALVCLDFCLDFYMKNLKSHSARIGNSLHQKGRMLLQSEFYELATPILRSALDIREKCFEDNSSVRDTLQLLGKSLSKVGCPDEAMLVLKKALREGRSNEDAEVFYCLGKLHSDKREFDNALDCFNVYISMKKRTDKSRNGLEMAKGVVAIGRLFHDVKNYWRTLLSYEQVLNAFEDKNSILVCDTLLHLGDFYLEIERFDHAIIHYKRCLQIQELKFGPLHEYIAQTLSSLGTVCFRMKHYSEAKKFHLNALQILDTKFGDCRDSATCWHDLANTYFAEGKMREAISCFQKSLKVRRMYLLPHAIEIGDVLHGIGVCLYFLQELDQAIISLKESLRIRLLHRGEDDQHVSETRFFMAEIHLTLGAKVLALENFSKVIESKMIRVRTMYVSTIEVNEVERVEQCLDKISRMTKSKQECVENFISKGTCQAVRGNFDLAISSFSTALKRVSKRKEDNSIQIASILLNIGICLNEGGNPVDAIRTLTKASVMIETYLGKDHIEYSNILFQIGVSYKNITQNQKALAHLEESLRIRKDLHYDDVKCAHLHELIGDIVSIFLVSLFQYHFVYDLFMDFFHF
jgi:tetratricopeptide (TPR) repeat protein